MNNNYLKISTNYTSIKTIYNRILRHPLMVDINLDAIVDYTVDFMRIVGVPDIFYNKISLIDIENYRGVLPCDWYQTIQIRVKDKNVYLSYASDTFSKSDNPAIGNDYTFSIQGNTIYTNLKKGILEISYNAILCDEDGFPMIPDNSEFYRALESYIKLQWFTILYDMGKIRPDVLQTTSQDYSWAVGACQAEFNRLDLSKAESFFNSFKTLLLRKGEFNSGFLNNGAKENIKIK